MSVILLILGILTAATGVAAVGFGIPINEFSLGTTLIVAGTTALTGGLILIGLSAVVNELGHFADAVRRMTASGLEVQRTRSEAPLRRSAGLGPAGVPVPRPDRLSSGSQGDEPKAVEPSLLANAEEVPLSPTGAAPQPAQPEDDSGLRTATPTLNDRAGAQAAEVLKASRLDFLFRSKSAPPVAQPGNFDALWPAEARSSRNAESQNQTRTTDSGSAAGSDAPVQVIAAPASLPEQTHSPAVLKSGVVDGMPYTLYADGSIEAKLPQGTVRFGSIGELRTHIESNS
jgi:hypothetical protein